MRSNPDVATEDVVASFQEAVVDALLTKLKWALEYTGVETACLGGGVAMAAGEENIVPEKIENLNLEWLWRLRTDTFFRLKRLIYTASIFFYKKISNYFKKVIFEELN